MRSLPEIVATYSYTDEAGAELFQVVRFAPKDFRQRRRVGDRWEWKLGSVRRVPYKLPELLADDGDRPVYIVEGEKDVDRLWSMGHVATCNPGGAGKWKAVDDAAAAAALDGRDVVIVADRDKPGRSHALDVAMRLRDVAKSVRVVEPPAPHKDVSDLLMAGGSLSELVETTLVPEPELGAATPDPWDDPHYSAPSDYEVDAAPVSRESTAPWESLVTTAPASWFTSSPPKRRWRLTDNRTGGAGVLPVAKVGMIIGEGGVSKTMIAIALALAITTGTTWLGCFDVEEQGRVLLLLGEEDAEEVQRRCYNVARATRTNAPPPDSIVVLPLAGVPCAMIEVDDRGNPNDTTFLAWVRSYVRDKDFAAIVIDPFSRFAGLDAETDNAAATRFVQACESLASNDTNVIILHHTNKTARVNGAAVTGASARGSSAIYDGVRWAAALSAERVELGEQPRADLSELVTLTIVKSNYSRRSDPVVLRRDAEHGGALLPLTGQEWEIVSTARETAEPSARRRAAREADRETRAMREAADRDRRQAEREAAARARSDEDDQAAAAAIAADPTATVRALVAAVRGARACGTDRALAAIHRVRPTTTTRDT